MLLPIQVIGALLSIYITFHDADVLLIMHNSKGWQKLLFFMVSLLFLGCCQLIQVKRAWSRQLHSPEVVLDMDDTKAKEAEDRAADAGSLPDFGAAERITPVALVTGVPFLLIHWVSATRSHLILCVRRRLKVHLWLGLLMSRPSGSDRQEDTLTGEEESTGDGSEISEFSDGSPCSSFFSEDGSMDWSQDSTVASLSDLYSESGSTSSELPCTKTLEAEDCAFVPIFIQSGAENVAVRSSALWEAVSRSSITLPPCHGGIEQNILQFLNLNSPDLFVEGWDGLFIWPEDIPRAEPHRERRKKATQLSL
eukprot:symbB.v1.2.014227.t1/scaffold1035.1/size234022/3